MKKAFALLLVFVLMFTLAIPSFAADSFVAEDVASVTLKTEGNGTVNKDTKGNLVTLTANAASGEEFKEWKLSGTKDTDYKIVEGALTEKVIKIEVINDVTATAVFTANNGAAGDSDGSDTSPESGYNEVALIAFAIVSIFGLSIAVKKVKA